MTRGERRSGKVQRALLIAGGCLVAAFVVSATLILPGMMSLSPGGLGVVATVCMALLIRRGLTSRRYVRAWLAVGATPLLAVSGFAAAYAWSFL